MRAAAEMGAAHRPEAEFVIPAPSSIFKLIYKFCLVAIA
jgi:hypothetical protein